MDEDTNRIYDRITGSFEEWHSLPDEVHLFCPKIDDDDEEDYQSPGPPVTEITSAEKEKRIQDVQKRKELTYNLSLLLGISKEQSGGWLHQWTDRAESFLTKCDGCILGYHMYRRIFLKNLRE